MARQRVVVAGAGFAGVGVAKALEQDCDVTLVAPQDHFVYLPLIHEVLSENVLPRDVAKPLADVVPRATLVHGRAKRVEGNHLVTAAEERIPFDVLVVAIGAQPNDFGVPGALQHGLTFYSVGDALRANATLKAAAASLEGRRPLRVTVVGASFTGVEVAGEAAELLDALSAPRQVTLLDALPTIFPRQSDKFRQGVMDGLARARLELRTQQRITEVRPDAVVVGEEALPSDVTFWCAGVKPRALEGVDPKVRPTLESVARPDIYVLGDAAAFPRELDVAKLAQTAEQQAKVAAHNILQPGGPKLYQPEVKGLIVSIGHGYAVAEVAGGTVFTGPVPWHVKRQLYKAKIAMATYA